MGYQLQPIGIVVGGRTEVIDDDWGEVEADVHLDEGQVDKDATVGLDEFSHVEVVYLFHQVDPSVVTTGTRHPRGNHDWPEVGILAQRGKSRPNRLGVSVCELLAVDGLQLRVRGLDAIAGTPVLDVKPYIVEFGPRGPIWQPAWASELMRSYW